MTEQKMTIKNSVILKVSLISYLQFDIHSHMHEWTKTHFIFDSQFIAFSRMSSPWNQLWMMYTSRFIRLHESKKAAVSKIYWFNLLLNFFQNHFKNHFYSSSPTNLIIFVILKVQKTCSQMCCYMLLNIHFHKSFSSPSWSHLFSQLKFIQRKQKPFHHPNFIWITTVSKVVIKLVFTKEEKLVVFRFSPGTRYSVAGIGITI